MSIEDKFEGENREVIEGEESREYFEYLRPLAEVFSNYGVFSLRVAPQAETFAFDHQRKEIIISPQLIERLNLEREEKKYVLLHEISHLVQLLQGPESYLESFKIPKEKAKKEGNPVLEKAYRNFFNVFFDIHANSIIRARMPVFQKGERLEELPKTFYSQKAFPERDYSSSPLSSQFLTYLLRRAMAPDEEVQLEERVKKEIEEKIDFFGAKYQSLEEFCQREIFNPHKTTRDIMFILKEFLMPIYEKLLREDIKEGRVNEIPDFLGEFNPDADLSEEAIEGMAKNIKEAKKSGAEKYKDYLERKLREWAGKKGFSKEETKRLIEIQERTMKIIADLEDLWDNFIQKSTEIERGRVSGFKTGATIAPEKLISELPILLTQPSEAKIFYRYLPETKAESIKPKKISLFLVVDLSGSMDEEKRKAVQEVAYSLNKSLINFYRGGQLQMADSGEEFPITIDYQIIGFGDSVEELTQRTKEEEKNRTKRDTPSKDLDQELLRAVLSIEKINLGGTQDALALSQINQAITPEIERNLKEGEEIMIILEITDGETATAAESGDLVRKFNAKENVYCRAIQILGPIYSEKVPEKPEERGRLPEIVPPTGTFKEVWGEDWGKQLKDLAILKETIVSILYDALRKYAQ